MTPALLFLRSELKRHRRGWAVVAVIAAIGMSVVAAAGAGAARTLTSFERFRQVAKEPNALLASEGNGDSPVKSEDVAAVDGVEVVGEAAAFLLGFTELDLVPGLQMIVIAAADDNVYRDVYVPRVIEGRMPAPDRANEVAINEALARDHDLGIGDEVVVSGPSPEQFQQIIESGEAIDTYDGPRLSVIVVGVTRTTSNLEDMTFQAYEALASRAFHDVVDDDAAVGARLTAVRLVDGDAGVERFLAAVDPLVPDDGPQFDPNYLSGTDGVNGAIRVQAIGLGLFALVALAATAIAVGQAVARQRSLAVGDAHLLAVLGLRRGEVVRTMAAPAFVVLATAAVAAIVTSIFASALLPFGLARRAEPTPGVRLDPLLHIGAPIAIAVLLLIIEVAAVHRAARGPASAVADTDHRFTSPTRAGALAAAARALPPVEVGVRLALSRGAGRAPLKSGFAGATFAAAAIAATAIVATTLSFVSDDHDAAGFPWDYKVALGPNGEAETPATQIVAPAADRLTISYEGYTVVEGRPTFLTGLRDVKGSTDLVLFDGRRPSGSDEIVLGRELSSDVGVSVGDEVDVAGEEFTVVGVAIVPIINSDQRHTGAIVNADAFERLAPRRAETDGQTLLVGWKPDERVVAAAIAEVEANDLFGEEPFRPTDLVNLRQLGNIPGALVAFLAFVGAAAVTHALVTVGRSRRNDFATLRALGFTRSDVRWAVAWHSLTVTGASVLVAIPLGVLVGRVAWQGLSSTLGAIASAQLPSPLLLVVPASLLIALAIALPIGQRAARHSVAFALRTE